MKREHWPAPVFEQDNTFYVGDRVRILPSRNAANKNPKKNETVGRIGIVRSGLMRNTNPSSSGYVGYEVEVAGFRDDLNAAGYFLYPANRLESAAPRESFGWLKCMFGSHKMVWGFGSPVPGHCSRGCGHREVDAS